MRSRTILVYISCWIVYVSGGPIIIDSRDGNAIINSDQNKVIEPINTNVIDNWNYTTPNLNIPILPDKVRNHTLPEIGGNSTPRLIWDIDQDKNTNLPQFVDKALKLLNLKQVAYEIENSLLSKVSCTACNAGAGLLQHYIKTGKSEKEIKKTIYNFCVNLKVQSARALTKFAVSSSGMDAVTFTTLTTNGRLYFHPVPKPKIEEQRIPEAEAPLFKVLHISDTHFDPYYLEGSNADCAEPLCCRLTNGAPISKEQAAGKWGDYRKCDTWNYTTPNLNIPILPDKVRNHTLPEIGGNSTPRLIWDIDQDKNTNLPQFVDKALKLLNLKQVAYEIENSLLSKVSCTACNAGAGLLQHYIKTGKSEKEIKKTIYNFCVNLKVQSARVCEGITELFAGEVIYVLGKLNIGPDEICSFIIGDGCGDVYNPYHEWEVIFPPVPKPKIEEQRIPEAEAPLFKVLHISDTHFDPYYLEGSNADCAEPLCCRLTNGAPISKEQAAGKWGDYRKCDTPKITVDNMLKHIQDTHPDIDYILWTGDLPPHDIWNQTKEENLKIIKETVKQMSEMFPNVPIFPALGNHESAPVNSFPPPFVDSPETSISWLYDEMDSQWRKWLPSSVSNTVRRGAFYSVLVRPGFRLISLNMNYCNNKNWWLLLNSTDPATELQWFIYELQSAEFNGEKVHVIGHIPPGHSDCLKVWSRNYYAIINRYESTIAAQFFGHTHYDEFEVFYDHHDISRSINIAYVGPSVSPYYDLNPGYRIYYIDGDHDKTTRAVIDHESWTMNLREANLYGYPIWFKLYSARQAFGMEALRPQDWDQLVEKMTNEPQLFELFYKYYYKASPVRPICDIECKKRILCDLRSGRSHDRKNLCQTIESRIDTTSTLSWREWIYNTISVSMV
ncbi:Calcineurin-like phosphoesterase [Popillia japonica]|uniref:Calcineurin-like phosphoesterase n=1 Tax=Popillia japonica TaxID=7064 RepID=A0AAW1LQR1_POPJA